MPIEFVEQAEGVDLVITAGMGAELHRSTHRTKQKAAEHLARLQGVMASTKRSPSVKMSQQFRGGAPEIDSLIDDHQATHAVITCHEILTAAPAVPMVVRLRATLDLELSIALDLPHGGEVD